MPGKNFRIVSNFFYLIPIFSGIQNELWATAFLSACVLSFGMVFHLSKERSFLLPDRLSAWLLIISNCILCYLGSFRAPYFWIAFLFLILSLFYHFYPWQKREYDLNHGLWHLYGSLITLFCIFTFVG